MFLGLLCLAQTESLSYHSPIFGSSKYFLWPNRGLKELLIIHHQQLITVMTQRSTRLKSNYQHWVLIMNVNFNFSFLVDVSLCKSKYIFTKPYQQKTDYFWNIMIHLTVKIGCSPLCLIFASQKFLTHVCIAVIGKQKQLSCNPYVIPHSCTFHLKTNSHFNFHCSFHNSFVLSFMVKF